jgi:rhomboid protease GluP
MGEQALENFMQDQHPNDDYLPKLQPTPAQVIPQSYFIVSWTLIALNVLIYAAMCLKGISPVSPTAADVLPWGADFGPMTLDGQWWRVLTSTFLHFGILHIGMNMYILYQVGPFTELLYGRVRFVLLYLLAGLAGSVVSLAIHPMTVSAGASGAIFGVYGALLAFLVVQRGVIPASRSRAIAQSAGIFLVYNLLFGLSSRTTDLSAHAGGFVAGFLAGCALARPAVAGTRRLPVVRTVGVAVVGLGMVAGSLQALARHDRFEGSVFQQAILGASVPMGDRGRVVYGGSVTKEEAERLSEALIHGGMGENPDTDVLVSRGKNGTELYLPVGDAWSHDDVVESASAMVRGVAGTIGGLPITVHLTDDSDHARRSFVVR